MPRFAILAVVLSVSACAGAPRGGALPLPSCEGPPFDAVDPVELPSRSATQLIRDGVEDLQMRVRFPRDRFRTMRQGDVVQVVTSFIVDETGRVACTDAQGTEDAAFLQTVRATVAETPYEPYLRDGVPTPFASSVRVVYRMARVDD